MEKRPTNAGMSLYLSVNECVAGRRRRLTETVAIHSMMRQTREPNIPRVVSESAGPRPGL
jgi:hypothetical protein